jgi:hypothetical protein
MIGLALFLGCVAVIGAGGYVRRRDGGSLLRDAGADGAAGALFAICLIVLGVATAPVAAVYGLGIGAALPLAVAVAGCLWLRAMGRSRGRARGPLPATDPHTAHNGGDAGERVD